jgi:adenosylcobinamide-phosphate synthase
MEKFLLLAIPLVLGYLLDLLLGDPEHWPHPVRTFGKLIASGERWLNRGKFRLAKGMLLSVILCTGVFCFFWELQRLLWEVSPYLCMGINSIWVFFGLANKGLITEGQQVFSVLQQKGLEAGQKQLSRIVGRDTSVLDAQKIRIAVLETMSENLSDGVIAPLFFYALAGVPGMMTYKMINTLDSMIGYRNERYEQFGKFAARLDDVANFIPARITALLMVLVSGSKRAFSYLFKYGSQHKSPNSGYPEAVLAGILHCRFGGPNIYHGIRVEKPYIGETEREIEPDEIDRVSGVNQKTCLVMIVAMLLIHYYLYVHA